MAFNARIGCSEWQDGEEFSTLEGAREYFRKWEENGNTMGLYSASFGYIETPDGDVIEVIDCPELDSEYEEDEEDEEDEDNSPGLM